MPIRKKQVNKVRQKKRRRVISSVQQRVKSQQPRKFHGSRRPIKKHSFTELEKLIHQTKKAGKKTQLKKYRSLYRQKLNAWASAWQAGRAKLLANQQKKRQKKQATLQAQQAKLQAKLQKSQRLKEIYSYFQKELNKEKKTSSYFTPHLDLPPDLAKYTRKLQRQHPDYTRNLTLETHSRGSLSF